MTKKLKMRKETDGVRNSKADIRSQNYPIIMDSQEQLRLITESIVASAKGSIQIAKEQNFKENIGMGVCLQHRGIPYFEVEFDVQLLKELAPVHDDDVLKSLLERNIGLGLRVYKYDSNGELVEIGKGSKDMDSTNKQ